MRNHRTNNYFILHFSKQDQYNKLLGRYTIEFSDSSFRFYISKGSLLSHAGGCDLKGKYTEYKHLADPSKFH